MTMHEVYIDCEFLPADLSNRGLLSMALVDNLGNSLYMVNAMALWVNALRDPWINMNVLKHIPLVYPGAKDTFEVRADETKQLVLYPHEMKIHVEKFFDPFDRHETILYAWCGAQDMTRLHGLWEHDWSKMPACIPHWYQDLEGLLQIYQIPEVWIPSQQPADRHHALHDARHDKAIHNCIKTYLARRMSGV